MYDGYEYPKVLYRAGSEFIPGDVFSPDKIYLEYEKFKVVKHTNCGVWIAVDDGFAQYEIRQGKSPRQAGCKWVALSGRKRFAYPTKEEALESLRIRKLHQITHAKNALALAENTLEEIKRIKEEANEGIRSAENSESA